MERFAKPQTPELGLSPAEIGPIKIEPRLAFERELTETELKNMLAQIDPRFEAGIKLKRAFDAETRREVYIKIIREILPRDMGGALPERAFFDEAAGQNLLNWSLKQASPGIVLSLAPKLGSALSESQLKETLKFSFEQLGEITQLGPSALDIVSPELIESLGKRTVQRFVNETLLKDRNKKFYDRPLCVSFPQLTQLLDLDLISPKAALDLSVDQLWSHSTEGDTFQAHLVDFDLLALAERTGLDQNEFGDFVGQLLEALPHSSTLVTAAQLNRLLNSQKVDQKTCRQILKDFGQKSKPVLGACLQSIQRRLPEADLEPIAQQTESYLRQGNWQEELAPCVWNFEARLANELLEYWPTLDGEQISLALKAFSQTLPGWSDLVLHRLVEQKTICKALGDLGELVVTDQPPKNQEEFFQRVRGLSDNNLPQAYLAIEAIECFKQACEQGLPNFVIYRPLEDLKDFYDLDIPNKDGLYGVATTPSTILYDNQANAHIQLSNRQSQLERLEAGLTQINLIITDPSQAATIATILQKNKEKYGQEFLDQLANQNSWAKDILGAVFPSSQTVEFNICAVELYFYNYNKLSNRQELNREMWEDGFLIAPNTWVPKNDYLPPEQATNLGQFLIESPLFEIFPQRILTILESLPAMADPRNQTGPTDPEASLGFYALRSLFFDWDAFDDSPIIGPQGQDQNPTNLGTTNLAPRLSFIRFKNNQYESKIPGQTASLSLELSAWIDYLYERASWPKRTQASQLLENLDQINQTDKQRMGLDLVETYLTNYLLDGSNKLSRALPIYNLNNDPWVDYLNQITQVILTGSQAAWSDWLDGDLKENQNQGLIGSDINETQYGIWRTNHRTQQDKMPSLDLDFLPDWIKKLKDEIKDKGTLSETRGQQGQLIEQLGNALALNKKLIRTSQKLQRDLNPEQRQQALKDHLDYLDQLDQLKKKVDPVLANLVSDGDWEGLETWHQQLRETSQKDNFLHRLEQIQADLSQPLKLTRKVAADHLRWLSQLPNPPKQLREALSNLRKDSGLFLTESTDFVDLFSIGQRPTGTCLHYGNGAQRRGLVGVFDPSVKLLKIMTADEKYVGRCLLRLVRHPVSQKTILAPEKVYLTNSEQLAAQLPPGYEVNIFEYLKGRANRMGLELWGTNSFKESRDIAPRDLLLATRGPGTFTDLINIPAYIKQSELAP